MLYTTFDEVNTQGREGGSPLCKLFFFFPYVSYVVVSYANVLWAHQMFLPQECLRNRSVTFIFEVNLTPAGVGHAYAF